MGEQADGLPRKVCDAEPIERRERPLAAPPLAMLPPHAEGHALQRR
jgi:hypothetical protein